MRWLLPSLCLAFAAPAAAQAWTPLDDDAAYTAVGEWLDADKSADENWISVQAHFAPKGVFYGEDSASRDDKGTVTQVGAWQSRAQMAQHKGLMSDFAMGVESLECARSECTVGMSHALTHLVLRKTGGTPKIVGLFHVDSVLDAPSQAKIDATLARWRSAIDQRYGASKAVESFGKVDPVASARAKAQVLNGAAIAMLKQKNFKGAIAALTQAVKTDPGHYLARYNLACAQSLVGDFKASQATLADFKAQTDCAACQVRLARAQQDADFAAQRKDAAFQAIVAGATVPTTTVQAIADAVGAVVAGRAKTLGAAVDPLRRITVTGGKTPVIAGRDLAAWLAELGGTVSAMQCSGACCSAVDEAARVRKVCATADGAGWVTIDRVEVLGGR